MKVTSPQGTQSTVLPPRLSDGAAAGFNNWPFLSVHFWGENPAGTWKFEVDNGGQAGEFMFTVYMRRKIGSNRIQNQV